MGYFFKIFLLLLFFTYPLLAQTKPAQTQSQVEEALEPGFSTRDFKPWLDERVKPWFDGDNGTGDWYGYRTKLKDKGVEIGVSSSNEVWGNVVGGLQRGSVVIGAIQIASIIDFEKLINWKGGSFYSRWLCLTGQDPSANLEGNIFTISNIYGYNTFRNTELWLQQKFMEDKLSLRAGQLVADSEFVISDYAALFLNSTFGWPAFMSTSLPSSGPNYPVGTPGVRLEWKPIEPLLFRVAAFQGNPQSQNVNNHGFYWYLNEYQGFFYIAETAYRYDVGLPGQVKAGAWFDSATFPHADGSNGAFYGNEGCYGVIDQMLYRKPKNKSSQDSKNVISSGVDHQKELVDQASDQGLGAFGRIAFEPENRNLLSFYCDSGLNYKGLIPTRDKDTLGVSVAYGRLSDASVNNQDEVQFPSAATGSLTQLAPGTKAAGFEMVIETTYQAQITAWLAVQPDIQYIIHPGASQDIPNAFVLGVRATVTF